MRSTLSMIRLLAIAAVATAYGPATAGRGGAIRIVVGSGTSSVPRGGGGLIPTKPKPLLKEAAIDLSIMGAAQLFFRRTHCTNARTCELARAVVACRAFFVTVQSYLLAIYVRQLGVARSMKQSAVVKEDLFRMRVRLTKASVKAVFLLAVHLHFGLMPPLVVSCVTAVVALPYWWDRESSYLGRNQISRRLNRRRNPSTPSTRRLIESAQVPTSPSTAGATASCSGPPSPSA
ncbi:unnamed protein product [Pelagomonas calceolata]|uniref:Uncharacterized protein n=1 Tax=Pelagomonas calceolata TaxID=35677 RepID=A0A8J2T077_9STRA|nr:unnamed protein product [Pelagomonas calceolata]|mmetsp:Transcript_12259/g.37721  ORF Transcript_12259/g.37721 Transcript_12259/m.37721 type:complete len:233 (-) Transcript_12259:2524-3222(-)